MLDLNELTLRDGVGAIAFTIVAASAYGLWGVAAGAVVLAVATLTAGPAAFVAAQLWIVAFYPQDSLLLAAAQAAVFPFLVSGVGSRRQVVSVAAAYGCALAVVWALVANLRWLWQAALLFVAVAGGLSYALHRYERVALGLVSTEGHR